MDHVKCQALIDELMIQLDRTVEERGAPEYTREGYEVIEVHWDCDDSGDFKRQAVLLATFDSDQRSNMMQFVSSQKKGMRDIRAYETRRHKDGNLEWERIR